MSKTYYPASEADLVIWLKNFVSKLAIHGPILGISTDDIKTTTNDINLLIYILDRISLVKKDLAELIAYKNNLLEGDLNIALGAFPIMSVAAATPTITTSGMMIRLRRMVKRIKANTAYSESIGQDLGVITNLLNKFSAEIKPKLKIKLLAGKAVLKWVKGGYKAVDIYVDRHDNKGYLLLATSLKATYTDNTALPTGISAVQWSYKIIYKKGDEQVGEFSDAVTVAIARQI